MKLVETRNCANKNPVHKRGRYVSVVFTTCFCCTKLIKTSAVWFSVHISMITYLDSVNRGQNKKKMSQAEFHMPSILLHQGNMAETGEWLQAERGDRQSLPGSVCGPAVQGPCGLQERSCAAADSNSGRHHHHLLLTAPLRRGHLHLWIHDVPRGEPRKHCKPHGLW